jgi:hypothetical protein
MIDARNRQVLTGVHPDLVRVIEAASERTTFRLTEGVRSKERQAMLVKAKKSKTMNSRHLSGHAVDFVALNADNVATYDTDDMIRVAREIKAAAASLGIAIEWGGDWKSKPTDKIGWDSPHVQLPWKTHPASGVGVATQVAEKVSDHRAVTTAVVSGAAVALPSIPAPPDITPILEWQKSADQLSEVLNRFVNDPVYMASMVICMVLWCAVCLALPMVRKT